MNIHSFENTNIRSYRDEAISYSYLQLRKNSDTAAQNIKILWVNTEFLWS